MLDMGVHMTLILVSPRGGRGKGIPEFGTSLICLLSAKPSNAT